MVELLHELSRRRERARAFGRFLLRWRLWESCALGHAGWLRFESLDVAAREAEERTRSHLDARPKEAELRGPAYPTDDAGLVELIAGSWEEAAINMHAMCAARDIPFLQVLEPARAADRDVEGVAGTWPELREAGLRLASRGIAFLDASAAAKDTGSVETLADAIARAVRDL
jgi:hypothetical protein